MKWQLWSTYQNTGSAVSPEKIVSAKRAVCFTDICLLSCAEGDAKKVLLLTYLEGSSAEVKKIRDQLSGYQKTTLSAKFINDARIIPGAGSYRKQLPQYFYEVEVSDIQPGFAIKIIGTEEALKEAVNALIVGGFCKREDFPAELKHVNVEDSRTMFSGMF